MWVQLRTVTVLRRADQPGSFITLLADQLEDAVVGVAGHGALPAQDPQVFAFRVTDNGPGVISSQTDDEIVSPEGPEKLHLQFCIATVGDDKGLARDT